MSITVADLDAMSHAEAWGLLRECGGAPRWVEGMVARRPFGTEEKLRAAADEEWALLGPADWRAAFAHHPRIGARAPTAAQGEQGRAWSAGEQSGVAAAAESVRAELAAVNRLYEDRFGHIYIVCAAGRSADELLRIAEGRLWNEHDRELEIAAEELRQIMQLRLAKLLAHDAGDPA